jgi:hypothetical protein
MTRQVVAVVVGDSGLHRLHFGQRLRSVRVSIQRLIGAVTQTYVFRQSIFEDKADDIELDWRRFEGRSHC